MSNIKRSWDLISEEKRKECIKSIIDYFKTERAEEIGIIASENILDHVLQLVAIDLYNKGIDDSKKILKERLDDIEFDLEALRKD